MNKYLVLIDNILNYIEDKDNNKLQRIQTVLDMSNDEI